MKRMLINATHSEEIRVALADGQKLYNLDIDVPGQERKKGNIYKGKITRVEPSLEAAFVDYGANRHGFLPYKEISRNYYTEEANKAKERPPINKAVKEGTEVIIQINKEERGNKGAAITTYISLAGRYMVYMPENPKAGGISRRIEGEARQALKATLSKLDQPKNSGLIVRTAGIGRSVEELEWDLNYLDQVWTAIKTVSTNRKAPFFIYQESDIFIRAIRDYLRPDVGEILIDNKNIYEKARDFMQQVMPHNLKKLSYYNDTIPLFSRYQIESQIQSAFARDVHLPSGGSIVIDQTEAMISIDINSARATKGADIEETALNTNLEAADEIARQLRIRDLGGLVVIDFIDMRNNKNQRSVEQQLNEAVSNDRARIQTSKISKFGLLEMSRQRLKSSINESSQFVCPRCSGHGFIRNIESLSVSILRIMEEEAMKPSTGKVLVQVPTKVANFIINDKREELTSLESRHSVPMMIIANEHYQTPQFDVSRLKKSELKNFDPNNIKLNKPESEEEIENKSSQAAQQKRQYAAVDVLIPDSQAPSREKESGVTSWIKSLFSSSNSAAKTVEKPKPKRTPKQTHRNPQKQHNKTKSKTQSHNKPKSIPNKQTNKPKQQVKKQPVSPKHQTKKQPVNSQLANKNKQVAPKQDKPVDVKADEQLLQRPLGSVASYAAKKIKQEQVTKPPQKAKPEQSAKIEKQTKGPEGNMATTKRPVKKQLPDVKKTANNPEIKKETAKSATKIELVKPKAKKETAKPESRNETAKSQPKKETAKPEPSKEMAKPQPKKETAKPESKKESKAPKTEAQVKIIENIKASATTAKPDNKPKQKTVKQTPKKEIKPKEIVTKPSPKKEVSKQDTVKISEAKVENKPILPKKPKQKIPADVNTGIDFDI